jgi:hypothetical protein
MSLGDINTGTGVSKFGAIKYGLESPGTRIREVYTGEGVRIPPP